jgi:hypothetical protein
MDVIDELLERNPRAVLGGNRAPTLAEELIEETRALAERALEMEFCADYRAEIIDDETASKAVQLIGQMKDLISEIESARVERKEPFLRDGRIVDTHFHAILTPLSGPDHKKKLEGSAGALLARVDAYRRKKEAEIEAERRRIEAEAKKQREEAEKATVVLQQGGTSQEDFDAVDLARRRAEDAAAALDARAAATVARPIDSGVGPKTSARKTYVVTIDDLGVATKHCMTLDAPGLTDYVIGIYQKQIRAGVRSLPGATIIESTNTVIRRK